jgi:hypothetical protein
MSSKSKFRECEFKGRMNYLAAILKNFPNMHAKLANKNAKTECINPHMVLSKTRKRL